MAIVCLSWLHIKTVSTIHCLQGPSIAEEPTAWKPGIWKLPLKVDVARLGTGFRGKVTIIHRLISIVWDCRVPNFQAYKSQNYRLYLIETLQDLYLLNTAEYAEVVNQFEIRNRLGKDQDHLVRDFGVHPGAWLVQMRQHRVAHASWEAWMYMNAWMLFGLLSHCHCDCGVFR